MPLTTEPTEPEPLAHLFVGIVMASGGVIAAYIGYTTSGFGYLIFGFVLILNGLQFFRSALKERYWRKQLDRRSCGFCPKCAYDLTGNCSGVCPECGTQVGAALPIE